jgi:predicted nuclease of restriction endonuclease-like (RecB) superfamily
MFNHLKNELHNIISGKSKVSYGTIIQTIASYLNDGSQSSFEIEKSKQSREEEKKKLINFITQNSYWITGLDLSQYVSEGAEQRVYLRGSDHVLTKNGVHYFIDTVFYITKEFWT